MTIRGKRVVGVLLEEAVDFERELYLALAVDRAARRPLLLLLGTRRRRHRVGRPRRATGARAAAHRPPHRPARRPDRRARRPGRPVRRPGRPVRQARARPVAAVLRPRRHARRDQPARASPAAGGSWRSTPRSRSTSNAAFRHPEWADYETDADDERERRAAAAGINYVVARRRHRRAGQRGRHGDEHTRPDRRGRRPAANFLDVAAGRAKRASPPRSTSFSPTTRARPCASPSSAASRAATRSPAPGERARRQGTAGAGCPWSCARRQQRRRGPAHRRRGRPSRRPDAATVWQAVQAAGRRRGAPAGGPAHREPPRRPGAASEWRSSSTARAGSWYRAITGREGTFHTQRMLAAGTAVVGGISPRKAGETVAGVPVFADVAAAVGPPGRTSPSSSCRRRRSCGARRSGRGRVAAGRLRHRGHPRPRHDGRRGRLRRGAAMRAGRAQLSRASSPWAAQRRHHAGRHLRRRAGGRRLAQRHPHLPDRPGPHPRRPGADHRGRHRGRPRPRRRVPRLPRRCSKPTPPPRRWS